MRRTIRDVDLIALNAFLFETVHEGFNAPLFRSPYQLHTIGKLHGQSIIIAEAATISRSLKGSLGSEAYNLTTNTAQFIFDAIVHVAKEAGVNPQHNLILAYKRILVSAELHEYIDRYKHQPVKQPLKSRKNKSQAQDDLVHVAAEVLRRGKVPAAQIEILSDPQMALAALDFLRASEILKSGGAEIATLEAAPRHAGKDAVQLALGILAR